MVNCSMGDHLQTKGSVEKKYIYIYIYKGDANGVVIDLDLRPLSLNIGISYISEKSI